MNLNLRVNEGCSPQPVLFWDCLWNPAEGEADWAYAAPSETLNIGGLSARASLETAVILALFTDRACPPDHPLAAYADGTDLRGWWGDAIDVRDDLGEGPIGSLLWLLERATATPHNALWAQTFALDALAPLVASGLAARVECDALLHPPSRLDLAVRLYGRDGAVVYARQFDDVWAQWTANGPILAPALLLPPGDGLVIGAGGTGVETPGSIL